MDRQSRDLKSKPTGESPYLHDEILEDIGRADAERLESNRKYRESCKGVEPGINIQLRNA